MNQARQPQRSLRAVFSQSCQDIYDEREGSTAKISGIEAFLTQLSMTNFSHWRKLGESQSSATAHPENAK